MTLGDKIRTRRIELGMTMDDLGKAIGVQRSAINKYEKGIITDLKRNTIAALASALDIPVVQLLDDDPDDPDQARLEALHQNPQLGMLFDRAKDLPKEDVDFMIQYADRIRKQLNNE